MRWDILPTKYHPTIDYLLEEGYEVCVCWGTDISEYLPNRPFVIVPHLLPDMIPPEVLRGDSAPIEVFVSYLIRRDSFGRKVWVKRSPSIIRIYSTLRVNRALRFLHEGDAKIFLRQHPIDSSEIVPTAYLVYNIF